MKRERRVRGRKKMREKRDSRRGTSESFSSAKMTPAKTFGPTTAACRISI